MPATSVGGIPTTDTTVRTLNRSFCSIEMKPSTASSRNCTLFDRCASKSLRDTMSLARAPRRTLQSCAIHFWSCASTNWAMRPRPRRVSRASDKRSPTLPTVLRIRRSARLDRTVCCRFVGSPRKTDRDTFSNSTPSCSSTSAPTSTKASSRAMNTPLLVAILASCSTISTTDPKAGSSANRTVTRNDLVKMNPIEETSASAPSRATTGLLR